MPTDFSTADLLERLDFRDEKAEVARSHMTSAIDRMADAMRAHNEGAATRHTELLTALKARDAGGVVAVSELASIRVAREAAEAKAWAEAEAAEAEAEAAAAAAAIEAARALAEAERAKLTWFQNASKAVAAEMWPLFRVPLGLVLAYWGARWSGALPAPVSSAVSIVSTTSTPDEAGSTADETAPAVLQ